MSNKPNKIHAVFIIFAVILGLILLFIATARPLCGQENIAEDIPPYKRSYFGTHWEDLDHDGENIRQEIIKDHTMIYRGHKTWLCLYTGALVTNPSELDIDHIVPLRYAWYRGAFKWSQEVRKQFANDIENLTPVINYANRSKGAKGPDEWLPPNMSYCIPYINAFEHICEKYGIPYDGEYFQKIITACSNLEKGVYLEIASGGIR